MSAPLATVVVVPRERFSVAPRALAAIYANTSAPFHLVYVDGGSPMRVHRHLASEASALGFTLVRSERYLTPNEARNLGSQHVRTRYIVFIDNDAVPEPGWLEKLLECAEATGAWIVGPIYLIGEPEEERIHMAGGDARIEDSLTGRRFIENHRFVGRRLAEVRSHLVRQPCEQVEFHCMLVRAEAFERLGRLDEGLRSLSEHTDFCMLARQHGGQVYFEPDARVTYITSGRLTWSDYAFFFRRWSEAWNESSIARFREKWNLSDHDSGLESIASYAVEHRLIPFRGALRMVERVFGWRARCLARRVLLAVERRLNRWWVPPIPLARRASAPAGQVRVVN